MANYYYVRDSAGFTGTATGDGGRVATTPRTGSWNATASESYVSISAALGATTAPAAGDYIMVAADHDHDYGATTSLTNAIADSDSPLNIVSVSTSNQDQYSAGGSESTTGAAGYDITFAGPYHHYGMTYITQDDLNAVSGTTEVAIFYECTWKAAGGSGCQCNVGNNNSSKFINCTFDSNGCSNVRFTMSNANATDFYGCTVQSTGGNWATGLFAAIATTRGTRLKFVGCDLSAVGSAGTDYMFEGTSISGAEMFQAEFQWCKLNTTANLGGWVDVNTTNHETSSLKATNCGQSSAEAEYAFFYFSKHGDVEHSTSTYRDQSVAWPISGSKTSLVIDTATAATATVTDVLVFDLPSRWAELSSATTDAITFYLSSNTSLTDADVWIECVYPDGTNKHTPNFVGTRATDILGAGTALTTDGSSTWTSGGSNKYKIKVDTVGDAGADGVPIMRIYVAVQATIYLDWYPELGT